MWSEVDELEQYLRSSQDEPELDEAQLAILDGLLAQQTDEERDAGKTLAKVISDVGRPTFRPEFAYLAEQDAQLSAAMEDTNDP